MSKFRLYIDESGTHPYSNHNNVKQRYLALIGVMLTEQENVEVLKPRMLSLRQLLGEDPDDLPILHREDIINRSGVFAKLADESLHAEFNRQFLSLVSELDYKICTIVLDKKTHLERYQNSAQHPYHYCLDVLLERYFFFLQEIGGRGDVLAEARGKGEDKALMEKYRLFYESGTYYCSPPRIQRYLTSKEIKVKPKSKMIDGLEFADLLSLATKLDTLRVYNAIPPLSDNFCKTIIELIQPKYRRSPQGIVKGFGMRLIT